MMSNPLVSVVLPTRNRAHLLPRAVHSVLSQTYKNLELIIVDDASTDNTREVLAGFNDPRLRVFHREVSQCAAAARNSGIGIARGEFVAFVDDDDFWLVQKLEKQVLAMRSVPQDVGWCLTGSIWMDTAHSFYVGGKYYIEQLDYKQGIGEDGPEWLLIGTPGWLVRRDVLQQVGVFDEQIQTWEDWELSLRLSLASKYIVVDEPLWVADWRVGGGVSRAEQKRANALRIIMRKHGHLWAGNRGVLARHYYVIGRIESLYDSSPNGRNMLYRSLRLAPLRPKTWMAIILSYMGRNFSRQITTRVRQFREILK